MTIETIQALKALKERIENMHRPIDRETPKGRAILLHYGMVLQVIDAAIAEQERLLPLPCETCEGEGVYLSYEKYPTTCKDCGGSGYAPIPPKAEKKVLGLCMAARDVRTCKMLIEGTKGNLYTCCEQQCPKGKDYYNGCYGVGPGGSADCVSKLDNSETTSKGG